MSAAQMIELTCKAADCGRAFEWSGVPGQAPGYCSKACKRRRSRQVHKMRTRLGIEREIVTITVKCARVFCGKVAERQWDTLTAKPEYCSARCAEKQQRVRWLRRQGKVTDRRCLTEDKLAFGYSVGELHRAARWAVRFNNYVYACPCFRFHLTSKPAEHVPIECIDETLPAEDREAAWVAWLTPIAEELCALAGGAS